MPFGFPPLARFADHTIGIVMVLFEEESTAPPGSPMRDFREPVAPR
jgi:hypothetical protein